MKEITLISWNVNGIRAVSKKEISEGSKYNPILQKEEVVKLRFTDWLHLVSPDALCLQETKAHPKQLSSDLINPPGYMSNFSSAERKGYSGVVTYSKTKPTRVSTDLADDRMNKEGRVIETEFPEFVLLNVYFPNGKLSAERLKYKLDFYEIFLEHVVNIRKQGKSVIICGDVNTAHTEIDLTHPKSNETISGFLPEERKWIDKLISNGFVDTFRHFNKDPEHYSWWSARAIVKGVTARERNVGWRIDYFFVSEDLIDNLVESVMMNKVMGSDHCPVKIKLKFD